MKMIDKWAIKLHYNLASIPLSRFIYRNWICGFVNLINANWIILQVWKNVTVLKFQLKIARFFSPHADENIQLFIRNIFDRTFNTVLHIEFVPYFAPSRCYRFDLWCTSSRVYLYGLNLACQACGKCFQAITIYVGVRFRLKSIANRFKPNGETFIICFIAFKVTPPKNWWTNKRRKKKKIQNKMKIAIANNEFGCANNLRGDLGARYVKRETKGYKKYELKQNDEMQIMMRICDITSSPKSVSCIITIFLYCIAVGCRCIFEI